MELTERLLISMGGPDAYKHARTIHRSGAVLEATWQPPMLRGKIRSGDRTLSAGLCIKNNIDVENFCSCRDSRQRGIICAHSLAVGLEIIHPTPQRPAAPSEAEPQKSSDASTAPEYSGLSALSSGSGERPNILLKIEGSLRHLEAEIDFKYTEKNTSNPQAEAHTLHELASLGFREEKGRAVLRGEENILEFYAAQLPKLQTKWQVTVGERFQHVTRNVVRIQPTFLIQKNDDAWLDLRIHYAAGNEAMLSPEDLKRLFSSNRHHLKLKSGAIAVADPAMQNDIEEVLRDCDPEQSAGAYRVAPVHQDYLKISLANWQGKNFEEPKHKQQLGSLGKQLRPYQRDGARWLLHHARRQSGALLADEMGLGKTVQTLAMLERIGGPSLVICPSSLVWNWKRECEKFLPDLKVLPLDGPNRSRRFGQISESDLILTSYALIRRDLEHFKQHRFAAIILDEAQHIKNPDSQNAQAARALQANSRFILTGTPVENSVRDIWSLFAFLQPGYLGSRRDFKDRYETPLQTNGDPATWQRLNRRLQPFVLRRKKSEILTDLPDKIEQVIEVEISPEQKTAYTQLQDTARSQIDSLEQNKSPAAARAKVFTALLRLRQASCDLRLLGAQQPTSAASAKLVALLELLGEVIDGNHRALVFSQFTGMLDLIERELLENKISFCRLDGSTKNRERIVDQFQNDTSIPVFLISLKAGGTGLNLTAADTVIHFDPWWNPAAEAQATDRAHRIGQKSVVTSIKLIAKDTIEERVLRMQQKKKALLEGAIETDATLEKLSSADLQELI
ncbi:MAG: DEAD/DEAH box helicase [Chthoniobacterales bacterium]